MCPLRHSRRMILANQTFISLNVLRQESVPVLLLPSALIRQFLRHITIKQAALISGMKFPLSGVSRGYQIRGILEIFSIIEMEMKDVTEEG